MASCSSSRRDAFDGIEPPTKRIKPAATPKLYDVFISHRGPDVKDTLAKKLYISFEEMNLRAFLDREEIEVGDSFPSAIQDAILSASVQIVIFSKGYAESAWCLAELQFMFQIGSKIIPIFYDVAPHDLRYIEKGLYAKAFVEYEKKQRYLNKLQGWKETLVSVSTLHGYVFSKLHNHDEDKLCKDIVSAVWKDVKEKRPLPVAQFPSGLDEFVQDFERWWVQNGEDNNNVKIIGIYGMGGSGKTTLAKELFNRKRSNYNGSCFLPDVREKSLRGKLTTLQSKLLKDLVRDNPPKFSSIDEGKSHLVSRLQSCGLWRFLIIVDDIDHKDQLDALVMRDELKSGSLVIVTTRDERVLIRAQISLSFKMKKMNPHHSIQLFCLHAFGEPHPASGYEALAESFVKACDGLPLSLKVLGSHVCGSTDKGYWKLELDKIEKTMPGELDKIENTMPGELDKIENIIQGDLDKIEKAMPGELDKIEKTMPRDIKERLRISFEGLDKEQKEIFMDIACFFIGKETCMAIRIWEASGWNGKHAIQTLKDRCLVEEVVGIFPRKICLRMHDHLRDLGRELADESSSPHRIWRPEHLKLLDLQDFQNIFPQTNVRCFNKYSPLGGGCTAKYFLGNSSYSADTSTALLSLEFLYLSYRKSVEIWKWIPLQNLQVLRFLSVHLERLWVQVPFQLKTLHLFGVTLKEFPDSIGMLSRLENLELSNIRGIHIEGKFFSESLTNLTNLKDLLLCNIKISGELALHNCPTLSSFKSVDMNDIIEVNLGWVPTLKSLCLHSCRKLERIAGISHAEQLVDLFIDDCPELADLPYLGCLTSLETISITRCWKLQNIRGIDKVQRLRCLEFCNEGAWNCIHVLEKLPSQTVAIGRAVRGVESALNPDLFWEVIGEDGITEINSYEKVSVKTPHDSLSAIIICALLREGFLQTLTLPCRGIEEVDFKCRVLGMGEWIVTIVMAGKNEVSRAQHYIDQSKWIGMNRNGHSRIKKGYMVTVKKGEEGKSSHIFKRIIGHLYSKKEEICPEGC